MKQGQIKTTGPARNRIKEFCKSAKKSKKININSQPVIIRPILIKLQ